MHVTKEKITTRAKSYTSIYDLLGSKHFNRNKSTRKANKNLTLFQATCGDSAKYDTNQDNQTHYVTSEQYNNYALNRDISFGSIVHSTSTIFCDLDDIAKRHSFHCMEGMNSSNVNLLKVMNVPLSVKGFTGNSDAIVQECATQVKPNLMPRDSIEIIAKKNKNNFPEDSFLSSEIFLKDDVYLDAKDCYYGKETTDRQQKFWSFAKYRTEYTNPIPEEKKRKKKDRGKRTEDPCPCQLFSYACPCTDKKSLTELAKNKSRTVDQITSTEKLQMGDKKKGAKVKRSKNCATRENKQTDYSVITEKYEVVSNIPKQNDGLLTVEEECDHPTKTVSGRNETLSIKSKAKLVKKVKKITCPNCRENVDVALSTTDEEESIKYVNSSIGRFSENASKNSYNSKGKSNRHKCYISEDNCVHNPRCELVPVCQILPNENVFFNHKVNKKHTNPRQPRIIRITKACRHHPPCTVVPSCQRTTVLKNNCEYIPPCLHRPRCVNLPLCVPASKTFHYDEPQKILEKIDSIACPHVPRCKYYPECQYDPVISNLDDKMNIVPHIQNTCDYHSSCQQSHIMSPKVPSPLNASILNQIVSPTVCCCQYSKSCQFDSIDSKYGTGCDIKQVTTSSEAVIFIRDVGCQFKSKKISNTSIDDIKMGNCTVDVHTLRFEDKWTSPVDEEDFSDTSISVTTFDSHCPAHGERSKYRNEKRSGFIPKVNTAPYVAYAAQRSRMATYSKESNELSDLRTSGAVNGNSTFSVKSRRSLKNRYKRMFSMKKRRKSRASCHGFYEFEVQNKSD